MLMPESARRCVRPVTRNASVSSGSRVDRSARKSARKSAPSLPPRLSAIPRTRSRTGSRADPPGSSTARSGSIRAASPRRRFAAFRSRSPGFRGSGSGRIRPAIRRVRPGDGSGSPSGIRISTMRPRRGPSSAFARTERAEVPPPMTTRARSSTGTSADGPPGTATDAARTRKRSEGRSTSAAREARFHPALQVARSTRKRTEDAARGSAGGISIRSAARIPGRVKSSRCRAGRFFMGFGGGVSAGRGLSDRLPRRATREATGVPG